MGGGREGEKGGREGRGEGEEGPFPPLPSSTLLPPLPYPTSSIHHLLHDLPPFYTPTRVVFYVILHPPHCLHSS